MIYLISNKSRNDHKIHYHYFYDTESCVFYYIYEYGGFNGKYEYTKESIGINTRSIYSLSEIPDKPIFKKSKVYYNELETILLDKILNKI